MFRGRKISFHENGFDANELFIVYLSQVLVSRPVEI